jgi:lysophospholipase L1-like esterase
VIDWRFWSALPALLPQALHVRATAQRLGPAEGPSAGLIDGNGAPLRLLLVGDSIIAGIGVPRLTQALPGQLAAALAECSGRPVEWQASGRGGDNARQVQAVLQAQLTARAALDIVVISVGVNDVTGLTSRRRWRAQIEAIHATLADRARLSVHLGLPPLERFPALPAGLRRSFGHRARVLDRIAAEQAGRVPGRLHLPMQVMPAAHQFASDGFHPNAEGCALWARDVALRIRAAMPELLADSGSA